MDGRARRVQQLTVAVVAALVPTAGSAQPGPPRTSSLSWTRLEGAESCIGTHDLAVEVEKILKRPAIVSPSESDRSIEGRVARGADGKFTATIVHVDGAGKEQGRRVLVSEGPDCRALDDSMSLVIALMIDPDAMASKPPDPVPKEKKVFVLERTRTPMARTPSKRPPPPPDYRIEGYLGAVTSVGVTPLSGGFVSGAMFDPSFFGAFEVNGVVTTSSNAASSTVTARFWKFEGGAYFCPLAGILPDRGRAMFQGALCAGGQAGFVSASGDGLTDASTDLQPLVNGAMRGRLGAWIYPVSLTLGATMSIPITRQTYAVTAPTGESAFFDSAPIEGTFDLSLGLEFPARP